MRDQAARLRELINKQNPTTKTEIMSKNKKTKVIAVTSGKGGVGKTNFTINLSYALMNLGFKVLLFDADIGFANVDVLLGIMPKYNISDVLHGDKKLMDIIAKGPRDLEIISGGSGIHDIMRLENHKVEYILNQFYQLENYADYLLIDTGAGLSNTVFNFINSSDEVIIITTPEPTSLTDAYAMMKALTINNSGLKIKLVVNRVASTEEAKEVYDKLKRVVQRFLSIELEFLGYVYDSKHILESVKKQTPVLIDQPNSPIAKRFNAISLKLIGDVEGNEDDKGLTNFVDNLKRLFKR